MVKKQFVLDETHHSHRKNRNGEELRYYCEFCSHWSHEHRRAVIHEKRCKITYERIKSALFAAKVESRSVAVGTDNK